MDCSTPGHPVHHQLPEFTGSKTHTHWVSDAVQPSHPLLSPSLPALNLSQHQSLFQWVSSSHQVAKVLEFQLQHQSFQRTLSTDLLQDGLVGSPCSPRDSQESSPTPLENHQFWCSAFFIVQLSHPYMSTGKTKPGWAELTIRSCRTWWKGPPWHMGNKSLFSREKKCYSWPFDDPIPVRMPWNLMTPTSPLTH